MSCAPHCLHGKDWPEGAVMESTRRYHGWTRALPIGIASIHRLPRGVATRPPPNPCLTPRERDEASSEAVGYSAGSRPGFPPIHALLRGSATRLPPKPWITPRGRDQASPNPCLAPRECHEASPEALGY